MNWITDVKIPSLGARASGDGADCTCGVGARFRVGSLSLRAGYERFAVSDIHTVDLATLGAAGTCL